jgi:MFS family permease
MFDKKIITRTVVLLSLVSLFNDVASEIVIPVMPVFLKSIGFSFFLIGLLEGVAESVAGISKGYFGNLSDHIGRRLPFVQFGYALSAIAKSSLAFISTVIPVFLSRVADKMGKGVRTSARDAILSDASPPRKKATVFGFHRGMDTVGAVIGPSLALIYLYYHPAKYQSLFAITFIPGILAVGITFLIKEKKTHTTLVQKKQPGFFSFLNYWKQSGKTYKIIVGGLLFFTVLNSSDAFLLLTIKNKGYSDQYMIGIYIFYNLIFALLSYPIGKLTDRLGMMKTIIASLLIFSAVYYVIGFAESMVVFLLIFAGYAIYAAGFDSTTKAIITEHCKKEHTGTALGFYNGCASILTILASSWTGFIWTHFNPQLAFIISASGTLLLVFYFLMHEKKFHRIYAS